jgi:hypothetical protein
MKFLMKNKNKSKLTHLTMLLTLLPALLVVLLFSSCAAQHGIDFGHWAGSAENVPLIHVYNLKHNPPLTPSNVIAVLPPLGCLPEEEREPFQQALLREAQHYFRAQVIAVQKENAFAEYLEERNLAPHPGILDFSEIARLGKLLGARYVLCSYVREFRQYPPQNYAIYYAIVSSESGNSVCEMDAHFNAMEQRVEVAMSDYLQSRRARPYDRTNLEIMLRSPMEYRAFVLAVSCRAMAETTWPDKKL